MKINDNLELSTIRSGKGDCVHLRFAGTSGAVHNVIIDSGPVSASGEFRKLYRKIADSGEHIDILFITHYDDDHIGGILKLASFETGLKIDSVYFNVYQDSDVPNSNLSATQNQRLFHLLLPSVVHNPVLAGDKIEIDGAYISILAPIPGSLSKAAERMKEADRNIPLASVSDWDKSFEALMDKDYPSPDTSVSNRASIVMVFQFEGSRLLLCGDAPADNIVAALGERTHFSLVKLPHHGSSRNLSEALMDRIDADTFLICADGTTHPDKMTIAKLIKHYGSVKIVSNYSWWMKGFVKAEDQHFIDEGKLTFWNTA